jgi:hypothetical protein
VTVARKGRKAACVRRGTVLEMPTHHQLGGAVKPRAARATEDRQVSQGPPCDVLSTPQLTLHLKANKRQPEFPKFPAVGGPPTSSARGPRAVSGNPGFS